MRLEAGFATQQRVRMLLGQPPGIEAQLRAGDWRADSRLMYLATNDLAARGDVKETAGHVWRINSELSEFIQN